MLDFLTKRICSWFNDPVFKRLFFNAGKLLSAKGISSIVHFFLAIITARVLGPEKYGYIALILVYELTFGKLISFNVWQAMIKYGSDALNRKDATSLAKLVKFGYSLDLLSAVLGTALAILLSDIVVTWLGWDPSIKKLLQTYSILILFSLSGTPIGVLRLFDRFDLLSYTYLIQAILKIIGISFCVLTKQPIQAYIWVHLLSGICLNLYQIFSSIYVLTKRGLGRFYRSSFLGFSSSFPGIWNYVWTTNVNSTIRMVSREMDELIIAGATTPAALGMFKLAKQFSKILPMLIDPLYQSIYPELTRYWAEKENLKMISLMKRSILMAGGVALAFLVSFTIFGKPFIAATAGDKFGEAYPVAVIYMAALTIGLSVFPLQPAMLAIGQPVKSFIAQICATMIYLAILFPAIKLLNIEGAALAYAIYYCAWVGIMFIYLKAQLKKAFVYV